MKRKSKIVEIKPQVRNSSRRTLVLDDGSVFGISEDVLLLSQIAVGDEISEDELGEILEKEDTSKVMTAALHLLEYRMRSISEIRQRLIQKQHETNKVDTVVAKLVEMGYLDDEKFAEAFARDKVRNRRIGPILLKQELVKHRINQDTLETILSIVYKEFSISDMVQEHIHKKISNPDRITSNDLKKLQNFLQRKGFTWDQIRENLAELKERISHNE